ncbi:hypothetical protein DCS_02540 [Drechmeria coniospora]|uniref:Senescence domain-containing protein n=1 Tax=Drechmeria coniospora TaxID=98403 RepID=A0A151GWC0_DRECN|nr:hypothetical protein DCS_02540 [Drechmeria coniospora]KYK61398.1 hypothetical protein DCS_02540 [Drechmeria coniospora]ODA81159.1 hypothetical protein RJ55_04123 [Drechmeria coniospora]
MASHSDPTMVYAIEGITATHIVNGTEHSLTPSGPQTLSLLMVPTSSDFADPSAAEQDFYLHLHLPPELDLPMPATTQIYHQPPTSYLIPRWDLGPDSGAFTRIEFPAIGSRPGLQEDVDTFETILAQCTAFLERASAPKPNVDGSRGAKATGTSEKPPPYNPSDYEAGEGYVQGSRSAERRHSRIVLVDEGDGSVIGELSDGFRVVENSAVHAGTKDPVEIAFPVDGSHNISVQPLSLEDEMHPAYKKSTMVSTASKASRLIVTTSDYVSKTLISQADSFARNTKPAASPVSFTPTTHAHIRRINTMSAKAAGLSAATVGSLSKVAQNVGAHMTKGKDGCARGYDKDGKVVEAYKPGVLNKSLMAFNTVIDGVEQAGRTLLSGTSSSASTVVGHRWGPEAGEVASHIGSGFKNVGLVYIDVTGVSRRAILKGVAKGMVVGRVKGGGQVIVGTGDGVELAPEGAKGSGQAEAGSASGGQDDSKKRPLYE